MFIAAKNGHKEIVELLISKGADVNGTTDGLGWTPLHHAAKCGYKEIAKLLINNGADRVAEARWGGHTPGDLAANFGHKEIVELLGTFFHDRTAEDDKGSISEEVSEQAASKPTSSAKYYVAHGLDLAPDAARKLTFEGACEKVPGLRILSDHGDWLEAAKGDDYSVLLYFNKVGGLFEAIISSTSNSKFLGMGTPEPEKVWSELGYMLQEDLGQRVRFTDGDAKIVAQYARPGSLNEIHYIVPEDPTNAEAEATAWRELGFFGGGRGYVESAISVSGECWADETAVISIIRYVQDDWKGSLPTGFWLVKAVADDTNANCRYCLGRDSRHDNIWQAVLAAMEEAGCLPRCESKPFRLPSNDLFMQTQIETIYIRGLMGQT